MPETKEQTIARLQREVERLKASLSAATQRQNAAYRVYGSERDVHLARLTVLDDIIGNPRKLHAVTLCTAEQFDYILHRYTAWIKEHGDTTLFWDDDVRASDPGNRSRLYIRHSLLLSLMRKKGGTTQAELAAMFGVDQSNINRSLEASNHILSEVLPTARRMTQLIREADTLTDLKRVISPDPATGKVAVVLDGTHVPVDRSGDKDRRRADYSGKKKAFTFNTNILTDTRKRILWISGTVSGSTHDLTLLKEDPPDLGMLTRIMSRYETPEPDRPALYVDKGYQGISGYYPGATIRQPARRRPNSDRQTGGLAADDRALNKEINGTRIVVERAIGIIKRYRITTRPFRGTPKELNDEINIISGLVNLNLDWDRTKKENRPLIRKLAKKRASR